ncbi:aldehyde dehydrogenase family protein [Salinisphaera sp. T31B1]|uniref:aldehyde dehydrogenase family protein n=1 Tax=Salinisphaera sp. T31B1 TaxID=727963 RepID=UPI00333F5FA8
MSTAAQDIAPAEADSAETRRLFDAQRVRALSLRNTTAAERIDKLKRLRQLMYDRAQDIYDACHADFAKPAPEVDITEILPVVMEANHAIRHLKSWMKPDRKRPTLLMFGTSAEVRYEPRGVCLIISPWNYPINLSLGPLVSAIAAGNTVILKPSEMTPHCADLMAGLLAEVFSEDEVAVVQGAVATSQHLLELPFDHIFFTGSPAVGRIVMRAAAEHLASVTLELGGKSPVIVDKTADIKHAATNLAWGKFANNGQTCIAPDYMYVHADIVDAFVEATRAALDKLYGKREQLTDNRDYCRIVNERHHARIQALIDDATDRGAHLAIGGGTPTVAADNYIGPTVLTHVDAESRVLEEEIFGPVLPIVPYTDLDRVIAAINAKPKPLALYVFARDKGVIDRVLDNTSAGGSCVNHSMVQFLHANLPFGGVNNSGIGNSHGHYGFKAFSHERAVVRERFSLAWMFLPPYKGFTRWFIRFAVRWLN